MPVVVRVDMVAPGHTVRLLPMPVLGGASTEAALKSTPIRLTEAALSVQVVGVLGVENSFEVRQPGAIDRFPNERVPQSASLEGR